MASKTPIFGYGATVQYRTTDGDWATLSPIRSESQPMQTAKTTCPHCKEPIYSPDAAAFGTLKSTLETQQRMLEAILANQREMMDFMAMSDRCNCPPGSLHTRNCPVRLKRMSTSLHEMRQQAEQANFAELMQRAVREIATAFGVDPAGPEPDFTAKQVVVAARHIPEQGSFAKLMLHPTKREDRAATEQPPACTCKTADLMTAGCTCGAMTK